jgi:hypothetical protein
MIKKILFLTLIVIVITTVQVSSQMSLPEFFGVYVLDSKTLIELSSQKLDYVVPFRGLPIGIDGIKSTPTVQVNNSNINIILYFEGVKPSKLKLEKLKYIDSMTARQFNYQGTLPQFFQNVYGVPMNTLIPINMWVYESEVQFRMAPVEGRSKMYRVVPTQPLTSGVYVLHFGEFNGTPHAVSGEGEVYAFSIKGNSNL